MLDANAAKATHARRLLLPKNPQLPRGEMLAGSHPKRDAKTAIPVLVVAVSELIIELLDGFILKTHNIAGLEV